MPGTELHTTGGGTELKASATASIYGMSWGCVGNSEESDGLWEAYDKIPCKLQKNAFKTNNTACGPNFVPEEETGET